ncbi:twin-arginine translocation signal domain-containing protein, partial [Parabacteroides goldsteinii]
MKRRDFLKTSVVAGAALSIDFTGLQAALSSNTMAVEQAPEMVAVMGGEPEVMLDKALETLGGIGKYIKKGQKVVIKPNIGWDRTPELAGNTNPGLIKALVKKCLEAG